MSDRLVLIPLRRWPASEADWVARLLAPLDVDIRSPNGQPPVISGALYLFNSIDEMTLSEDFLERVRNAGGCGLMHLGDEYYRGDYRHYAAFDYVIRMFPTKMLDHPGVFNMPLGFTRGLGRASEVPASQRRHSWMFAGDWKADRGAMADDFADVEGGFLSLPKSFKGEVGISRADYIANLADAVFALCPAGNVCLETCRPYEALELGAVPLLPKRWSMDAYANVLGDHPLPTFSTWKGAQKFVRAMRQDPVACDALQQKCLSWWAEKQAEVSLNLIDHIAEGRSGAFREGLRKRFRKHGVSGFSRAVALMRQQNFTQLKVRFVFAFRRALNRLRGQASTTGIWSYRQEASTIAQEHDQQKVSEIIENLPKSEQIQVSEAANASDNVAQPQSRGA